MRWWGAKHVLVGTTLLAALTAPPAAQAGGHGPKVDTTLAQVVDSVSPDTQLHVFVFGASLGNANSAVGVLPRNDLDVVGGESVTVPASKIDQLAAQAGVQ